MSTASGPARIVVVGTGTGVGKTWLSCAILRRLRTLGRSVVGLKPIESGVTPDAETDGRALARAAAGTDAASGMFIPSDAPYQLPDPVSPHLAARRVGAQIDLAAVLTYVQKQESALAAVPAAVSVVESAGGLLSPLAPGVTNFDLGRYLEPARWLLVAPDSLGVLHDLTATLTAARSLGRVPDAIALCRPRPADESTGTNADEIARLGLAARPWVFPPDGDVGLDGLLAALLG